jgi:hypothetical protein
MRLLPSDPATTATVRPAYPGIARVLSGTPTAGNRQRNLGQEEEQPQSKKLLADSDRARLTIG